MLNPGSAPDLGRWTVLPHSAGVLLVPADAPIQSELPLWNRAARLGFSIGDTVQVVAELETVAGEVVRIDHGGLVLRLFAELEQQPTMVEVRPSSMRRRSPEPQESNTTPRVGYGKG